MLHGVGGYDTLIGGGPGRDILRGEGGNDVANGGSGRDVCQSDPRDIKRNCP
ncbi:MAG: hypothetical protein H0V75_13360 [Rubrobacter sp.]|nr:hypothetical protein [Rubrobacter sp.]